MESGSKLAVAPPPVGTGSLPDKTPALPGPFSLPLIPEFGSGVTVGVLCLQPVAARLSATPNTNKFADLKDFIFQITLPAGLRPRSHRAGSFYTPLRCGQGQPAYRSRS